MRPLRAPLVTTLLLLALTAGCGASGGDSTAGGAVPPPGGGGPRGGSGGGGGGGGGGAAWQEPAEIDEQLTPASAARVAVDPDSGDAVAVWLQSDGSRAVLWASRLDRSTGDWSAPEPIDDGGIGGSSAPQLAADGQGNVFAVWIRDRDGGGGPTEPTVWVARRTAAGSWGSPFPLDAEAGRALSPRVAANASGEAVVAWIEPNGADDSLWTSRFDPSSGDWSTPSLVEGLSDPPVEDAASPWVALADTGDAFVAWLQPASTGASPSVWASRLAAGASTWEVPEEIDDQLVAASSPKIGADAGGNAVVLWEQDGSVHAARYVEGELAPWTDPEPLDTSGLTADHASLAVAPTGHAVAIWRRADGGGRIWGRRLDSGAWSAEVQVQTSTTEASDAPHVALDASGNAVAVWQQDIGGGVRRVRSSRLATTEDAWSDDEAVKEDNAPADDATEPRVAVDADGDAVAVWLERAGSIVSVWGNVRE